MAVLQRRYARAVANPPYEAGGGKIVLNFRHWVPFMGIGLIRNIGGSSRHGMHGGSVDNDEWVEGVSGEACAHDLFKQITKAHGREATDQRTRGAHEEEVQPKVVMGGANGNGTWPAHWSETRAVSGSSNFGVSQPAVLAYPLRFWERLLQSVIMAHQGKHKGVSTRMGSDGEFNCTAFFGYTRSTCEDFRAAVGSGDVICDSKVFSCFVMEGVFGPIFGDVSARGTLACHDQATWSKYMGPRCTDIVAHCPTREKKYQECADPLDLDCRPPQDVHQCWERELGAVTIRSN